MSEESKARVDCTKFGHEPLRSLYGTDRYLHDSGIQLNYCTC